VDGAVGLLGRQLDAVSLRRVPEAVRPHAEPAIVAKPAGYGETLARAGV
jgi:hypothetical protein